MASYLLPTEPIGSIDEYLATDIGGLGLARARELGAEATIDVVSASGLRGRGGAGFPTGRKWRSVASGPAGTRYAVCNAAEGEPATFKDRALMRANPYQMVEGLLIAALAVGAREVFIALKASFTEEVERVTRAVQEMQEAGIASDCTVNIVPGPEEYLFGEEKALLEVIEGRPPLPRLFPPYEHGLFASDIVTGWEATQGTRSPNPTLVNNLETLSSVPHILVHGADWFRSMGTEASPGNVVATVVGDVVAPDVGEVELGTPIGAVIDAVASAMGAAGYTVLDDTACMVTVAHEMSRFLYVESCGQCPPCKLGSEAITAALARIEAGVGDQGDIDDIDHWLGRVTDGNRCYLAIQERLVVASIVEKFGDEFTEHLTAGACPRPRSFVLPKLADLHGGKAFYDEAQRRKRPDWTYEPE